MKISSLILLASTSVFVHDAVARDTKFYVGANVLNAKNEAETVLNDFGYPGVTVTLKEPSRELGASLNLGKNFRVSRNVYVSLETEITRINRFDMSSEIELHKGAEKTFVTEEFKIRTYSFNVKPKYYVLNTQLYFGPTAGLSFFDTDENQQVGFNYGIETGIDVTPYLSINAGYRIYNVDLDIDGLPQDYKVRLHTSYVGLKYKF